MLYAIAMGQIKRKRKVAWKIIFAMSIGKTRIVKSDILQNNLVYTKTGKELQGGQQPSKSATKFLCV